MNLILQVFLNSSVPLKNGMVTASALRMKIFFPKRSIALPGFGPLEYHGSEFYVLNLMDKGNFIARPCPRKPIFYEGFFSNAKDDFGMEDCKKLLKYGLPYHSH